MSDSGYSSSPTLASLGATRPRPRRNHQPTTPRVLSPSCDSLPSLFDDDQLAAFFPSVSTADTNVPGTPSSAPSILKSNHSDTTYRHPSLPEKTEEVHDEGLTAPVDGAEETKDEKKRMKMEEGGEETEARRENGGDEEERVGDNGGRKEDEKNAEGDEEGYDKAWKEEKGRESWTRNEEGERNEETSKEENVKDGVSKSRRMDKEGVALYPSTDDEIFNGLYDAARKDAPMDQEIPTGAPPDSPFSLSLSSYPDQTAETPHRIPRSLPTCSTPDSIPDSTYTTDDAAPTEILSSPQSTAYEDEEVPNIFVFPPKISRLGSIYSNLGYSNSGGDSSSSDNDDEARETLPRKGPLDTESQKQCGKGDIQKRARSAEYDLRERGTNDSALNEPGKSHSSGRSSLGSLSESVSQSVPWLQKRPAEEAHDGHRSHAREDEAESEVSIVLRRKTAHKASKTNDQRDDNQITRHSSKPSVGLRCSLAKKVPPPKPPRQSATARAKNNDEKRMSREDPVRYGEVSCIGELTGKRSCSMTNILESNLEETTEKRCSQPTRSPAREVPALLQTPGAEGVKRERKIRGSFKYKDAAKIVSSIMSKKPPFAPLLNRKDASRHKGPSPTRRKMPSKDVEVSPPPSPAAVEEKKKEDVVTPPSKPARTAPVNDMSVPGSGSLDKAQTTCSAHGALLHFYCVKCRVVVCRDCTVVAHTHDENHRVLDTLDSLAMLRSEAVEMLRHYTILESMHAVLLDIYRKFRTQHRGIEITAIKKRLDEGKYLGEVVKEAECMVTTWTNLQQIRECVSQWEERQDEWGDLVFLASRCALLTDMNIPSDTVFLRMGNWVMPTPWIQLSHLLQPYLSASTAPQTPQSSNARDTQLTPSSHRKAIDKSSPIMRRSASPYGGKSSTGGTDQPFPYNARQIVLSNLIPYIILNPDIRYFVHVGGPRDVDLTLVVVPVDDHAKDCLKQRRNNANKSPGELRQANSRPTNDAITLVEQQMTAGACKTRITASSMPFGPSSAPTIVKVSFSDVKIVSDGLGLPRATGGVKRGDVVVDQSPSGQPTLTVMLRDIADFSAKRVGQVTWGMDGLTCLVSTEDAKRTESSGFRAKIRATVKREEEAVYDVMFGMDL